MICSYGAVTIDVLLYSCCCVLMPVHYVLFVLTMLFFCIRRICSKKLCIISLQLFELKPTQVMWKNMEIWMLDRCMCLTFLVFTPVGTPFHSQQSCHLLLWVRMYHKWTLIQIKGLYYYFLVVNVIFIFHLIFFLWSEPCSKSLFFSCHTWKLYFTLWTC